MLAPCTHKVIAESIEEDDEKKSIPFPSIGEKRCLWEASLTSLKSKRIKGSHPSNCGISDWSSAAEHDLGDIPEKKAFPDALCNDEQMMEIPTRKSGDFPKSNKIQYRGDHRIFLMNISDENKKKCLSKVGIRLFLNFHPFCLLIYPVICSTLFSLYLLWLVCKCI